MRIRERAFKVPVVGRRDAAEILGVAPNNLRRNFPDLPRPLNDRGIEGFQVAATPLWPRAEIEELRDKSRGS